MYHILSLMPIILPHTLLGFLRFKYTFLHLFTAVLFHTLSKKHAVKNEPVYSYLNFLKQSTCFNAAYFSIPFQFFLFHFTPILVSEITQLSATVYGANSVINLEPTQH